VLSVFKTLIKVNVLSYTAPNLEASANMLESVHHVHLPYAIRPVSQQCQSSTPSTTGYAQCIVEAVWVLIHWKVLDFFVKIPGPGKSWKSTLVLESPGKISLKIMHFLLVLMENKQCI